MLKKYKDVYKEAHNKADQIKKYFSFQIYGKKRIIL